MVTQKLFTPSSRDLLDMIARAEAKFDASREQKLAQTKPEYVRRGELRELVEGGQK